jgi:chemotaxis protein CheD
MNFFFNNNSLQKDTIVGVADFKVSNDANAIITTYALGSCLGITFYEPNRKIGAMLHAMLPSSTLHAGRKDLRLPMFIDTGVREVLKELHKFGIAPHTLECKAFGAAQVLNADKYFRIGEKNVTAFQEMSTRLGMNVSLWEVGGQLNRTIRFHLMTGQVSLKLPNKEPYFV